MGHLRMALGKFVLGFGLEIQRGYLALPRKRLSRFHKNAFLRVFFYEDIETYAQLIYALTHWQGSA